MPLCMIARLWAELAGLYSTEMEKKRNAQASRSKLRKRRQKERAVHAKKHLQLSYDECCKELQKEKRKCDLLSR